MPHNIPKLQYLNYTDTGTTSVGLATITGLTSTATLAVGMEVVGAGIPAGTQILTVDSATQITMTANATASAAVPIDFYFEIVFSYPPVEPRGEKLDPKERISVSVSGVRQVSIDHVEAIRTLNFSFLTEAQKTLLYTFFTTHGVYGYSFRYFDDQNSISYIDYELRDLKFEPKKIAAKTANTYVWEIGLTFRRVL